MGSDSLLQLDTWHEPEELLSLCSLAVAPRPGDSPEAIVAAARRAGATDRVTVLDVPALGISSTDDPRARRAGVCPSATWCRTAWSSTSARRGCTGERRSTGREAERAHRRAPLAAAARALAPGGGRGRRAGAALRRVRRTAELAGLLHDYCRELPRRPRSSRRPRGYGIAVGPVEARRPKKILHGPVAAAELAERGLDAEVAGASPCTRSGGAGMTVLEKCLYLADFCEPGARLPRRRRGARAGRDLAGRGRRRAAARLSLLDLIGRGRGVVPGALALYNETHAGT